MDHNHIFQRHPDELIAGRVQADTGCPACDSIDLWHLTKQYIRSVVYGGR